MSRRASVLLFVVVFALVATGFFFWFRSPPPLDFDQTDSGSIVKERAANQPPTIPSPAPPPLPPAPAPPTLAPVPTMAPTPGATPAESSSSPDAPRPENHAGEPLPPPAVIVERVRTTIRQYGLTFNGNPVGTNAEITAALNGGNPRGARFLGGDDTINSNGELTDPWGTPYFFHQLSAREMEVRSAGPDQSMYTADDLIAQ